MAMHKLCVLLQSMYPPWANAHWFGGMQSSVLLVPMHRDLTWCSSAQTLINQLSAVRQTARSTLLLLTMHFVPTYQKHVLEISQAVSPEQNWDVLFGHVPKTLCTAHCTEVSSVRVHANVRLLLYKAMGSERSFDQSFWRNTHGHHMLHVSRPADACE